MNMWYFLVCLPCGFVCHLGGIAYKWFLIFQPYCTLSTAVRSLKHWCALSWRSTSHLVYAFVVYCVPLLLNNSRHLRSYITQNHRSVTMIYRFIIYAWNERIDNHVGDFEINQQQSRIFGRYLATIISWPPGSMAVRQATAFVVVVVQWTQWSTNYYV